MSNYIFTMKVSPDHKFKKTLCGYPYILDRKVCENLCLEHYDLQLPKDHNLLQINGLEIILVTDELPMWDEPGEADKSMYFLAVNPESFEKLKKM